MKKKATEDQFNELHNLVTKEFLARIKSGEASYNSSRVERVYFFLKLDESVYIQYVL